MALVGSVRDEPPDVCAVGSAPQCLWLIGHGLSGLQQRGHPRGDTPMASSGMKLLRAITVALLAVLAILIPSNVLADETHHIYRTDGYGVWLHATAELHGPLITVIPEGARFDVSCFEISDYVEGDPVWLYGTSDYGVGFVTDFYVDTTWNSTADLVAQGIPACGTQAPAGDSGSSSGGTSGDSGTISNLSPCMEMYPNGFQSSTDIFGGTEMNWDREASLYQVCEGFGAPEGLSLSPSMQCALIAAAATYGGPVISEGISRGCQAGSIISDLESGQYLNGAASVACDYFGQVFATGTGIFAAGAAAGTGPGAVAVGVQTYRALAAGFKVACGGLFDGGAHDFGEWLESSHQTNVAVDIIRHGQCLREQVRFGQTFWSAADC